MTMTTLDPITARMFPTLAAYARRTRRVAIVCSHALLFLFGMAVTFLFLGYHQHVATENQGRLIGRIAALEDQYQRDHPALRVSKVQATDWAWQWKKAKKEAREP